MDVNPTRALDRDHDSLERFVFEDAPIHGRVVHLDATWRAVLERRAYPEPVRELLGEFMAAAALLTAIDGRLILQVQSNGPVRLLVVECSSERAMRALAQWHGEVKPMPFSQLLGHGRLVITIDPQQGKERYQGVVELEGDSVAQVLEGYFKRSEQLDTRIWLASDTEHAAGMILQKLPDRESEDSDIWDRAAHLGSTLTRDELLTLPARDILHRLYHEEDIRLFQRVPVSFRCTCTRSGVERALHMMGEGEVRSILKEKGRVDIDCEYCGSHYELDTVEIEQLFAVGHTTETERTRH
ncbi:MAG TPA: Hsp33 family molecular chaperone HslO [Burkholderiales bacterium]|nr:Hsp33 family molecular chaperone HslO [Burkholderiales bacterium]